MKKAFLLLMILLTHFGGISKANIMESGEEIPMTIYNPGNSDMGKKAPRPHFVKPTVTYDSNLLQLSIITTDNVNYMEVVIYDEMENILYQQVTCTPTNIFTFTLPTDVDEMKDHICLTINGWRFMGYF